MRPLAASLDLFGTRFRRRGFSTGGVSKILFFLLFSFSRVFILIYTLSFPLNFFPRPLFLHDASSPHGHYVGEGEIPTVFDHSTRVPPCARNGQRLVMGSRSTEFSEYSGLPTELDTAISTMHILLRDILGQSI
jgi:hypothetical protein